MVEEEERMEIEENENEPEKPPENKEMESTILDSFTELGSAVEKTRIDAGLRLLRHLNSPEGTEKEITYAMNRLIRGAATSRKDARNGFYSALVALLTTSNTIKTETVLESIKQNLRIDDSSSKSEKGNIYLGQILVCGALIRSKMFTDSPLEEQNRALEILFAAAGKRSYLTLIAFDYMIEFLEKLNVEQFQTLWPIIKPEVSKPWSEQTVDTIRLFDFLRSTFPDVVKQKFVKSTLGTSDVVHSDSVKSLSELLLNVSVNVSLSHPIFEYIGKKIASQNCVVDWCAEIDRHLLKPTKAKLSIVLRVMTPLINNLTDLTLISEVLTNQLIVSTLTNTKSKSKDDCTETIVAFYHSVATCLNKAPAETKLSVLVKLLFDPGNFAFEKIVQGGIIKRIIAGLDAPSVKALLAMYKDVVMATRPKASGRSWTNQDRIHAGQIMIRLLGHRSVQGEMEWKLDNLKFLFRMGFVKGSEGTIGVDLARELKECFYRALDQKLPKLEDLRNLLSSLVNYINDDAIANNALRSPLSEENVKNWNEMLHLVSKLEMKKKRNYALPVFHTLLLHMGLQLFQNAQLAQNSLKELHSCYSRIKTQKSGTLTEGEEDSSEPFWIEVLVDLFLNLLSQNSHLLRNIINCVFPHLCPKLTGTAVRQILDILDPKNDQALFQTDSDEEEDDVEEESDEEVENEEVEGEDASQIDKLRIAVRDVLHKSGHQTDDESEDIDNMDEEEGLKLDKALAEAFRSNRKPKKNDKQQNKDKKGLTDFRIRVLDLIDLYLDSDPSLTQCLDIITVLLQTLEFSINDPQQKELELRLRSSLKKLTSKKCTKHDASESVLLDFLTSFLHRGSRSTFTYQEMGSVICECCIFVINASSSVIKKGYESKITIAFRDYLDTFFRKRDCLLNFALFRDVIRSTWEGIWILLPRLVSYAFDQEIRPFRRNQALELLTEFYLNKRFHTANAEDFNKRVKPIEKQLSDNIIALFASGQEFKDYYRSLLMNLLSKIKSDTIDLRKINGLIKNYCCRIDLAKDLKTPLNELSQFLSLVPMTQLQSNEVNSNNNSNSGNDSNSENNSNSNNNTNPTADVPKEKKRKVKSKEAKLAKRRKEELRAGTSSEGLEGFMDFSAALSETRNNEEENEDTQEKAENGSLKKKKKKGKTDENAQTELNNPSDAQNSEEPQNEKRSKTTLKKKATKKSNSSETQVTKKKTKKKSDEAQAHPDVDVSLKQTQNENNLGGEMKKKKGKNVKSTLNLDENMEEVRQVKKKTTKIEKV